MKKSKLLKKNITKLVEFSFKDGRLVESQVTKAIKALKALPKYEAIPSLLEYLKGLKRVERQYTMIVETSIPLPPATVSKMKRIIEKKKKITKMVVNINPQILGGFRLKIGDEVYDESILGKINQVKEAITHGRLN